MNTDLNIPSPLPPSDHLETQLKGAAGTAVPIVKGKVFQKMPGPVQDVAGFVLNPPSPQDVIRDFLFTASGPQAKVPAKQLNVPKPDSVYPMQPLGGNALNGDPLYHKLEIEGQNWTDFNKQPQGFPSMTFDTVLIKTRQHKNIVITEIQGSDDGAVFEYSGLNNYDVELNIIVTNNKNGVYPGDAMDNLIKMCEAQLSVKVDSWYLQHLNIFELVLIDYDISQEPGGISQQAVIIQARSNKQLPIIIQ